MDIRDVVIAIGVMTIILGFAFFIVAVFKFLSAINQSIIYWGHSLEDKLVGIESQLFYNHKVMQKMIAEQFNTVMDRLK